MNFSESCIKIQENEFENVVSKLVAILSGMYGSDKINPPQKYQVSDTYFSFSLFFMTVALLCTPSSSAVGLVRIGHHATIYEHIYGGVTYNAPTNWPRD